MALILPPAQKQKSFGSFLQKRTFFLAPWIFRMSRLGNPAFAAAVKWYRNQTFMHLCTRRS
jgi:hypothetical protein